MVRKGSDQCSPVAAAARILMMARLLSLIVLSSVLHGFISAEPDYCKRGVKISEAYQHCFEEAHYRYPYLPLSQPKDIIDGCMVEDYNNHTCRVVKPAALECFRRNISRCYYRERLFAIADESGGACFGNHINRDFKENVLNYLQPVRADSKCFILADNAYECYSQAGDQMHKLNPDLHLYTVDEFMPVADKFFDSVYNCFIRIYKSNEPICENWQIPLLLELQGTALPSLFGMTFSPEQMAKLGLHNGCPVQHRKGEKPFWRNCQERPTSNNNNDNDNKNNNNNKINNRPHPPAEKPAIIPRPDSADDQPVQPSEPKPEPETEQKKKNKKKKNRKNKHRKGGRKNKKGRKRVKGVKGVKGGKWVKGVKGGKAEKARPISPRFLQRLRETLS